MKTLKLLAVLLLFIFSLNDLLSKEENNLLLFKPLIANVFEPRVGSFYQFSEEKLRLDIGASYDLKHFTLSEISKLSVGADFFTYTRLRTAGNFKFPVETSDYFFGVNSALKTVMFEKDVSFRLRVAHISSHLVDGMAKDTIFSRMPFVYSREFVDLIIGVQQDNFRVYFGGTFLFHSIPDDFFILIPQIGVEYCLDLNNWLEFQFGLDVKAGLKNHLRNNYASQLGLLFRTNSNIGLYLGGYYFYGNSMHGMFYDVEDNYFGLGFQIIFY